jgi:hypothetical protein
MPFKKVTHGKNKGKFTSPSGKLWTLKQMRLYYATDKFKKKPRGKK